MFTIKRLMIVLIFMTLALLYGCKTSTIKTGYIQDLKTENGMSYNLYIPGNYQEDKSYPLFIMLHGGIQTAGHFAFSTDMNEVAEEKEVIVIYPEQSISRNEQRYWNWFLPENQRRDGLELMLIMETVDLVISQYNIQTDAIYSMGLSAGAAMALNLAIAYSDRIQGVALAAGVPYGVADNVYEALAVMDGVLPSMETAVEDAYMVVSENSTNSLKVLVFHGKVDSRVSVENAYYTIEQMAQLNDLMDNQLDDNSFNLENNIKETLLTEDLVEYDKTIYYSENQDPMLGLYIIKGMGHAWPGGNPEGMFVDSTAPNMSKIIYEFFIENNN